eukprot:2301763-Prymnesium_polylepis.2
MSDDWNCAAASGVLNASINRSGSASTRRLTRGGEGGCLGAQPRGVTRKEQKRHRRQALMSARAVEVEP